MLSRKRSANPVVGLAAALSSEFENIWKIKAWEKMKNKNENKILNTKIENEIGIKIEILENGNYDREAFGFFIESTSSEKIQNFGVKFSKLLFFPLFCEFSKKFDFYAFKFYKMMEITIGCI